MNLANLIPARGATRALLFLAATVLLAAVALNGGCAGDSPTGTRGGTLRIAVRFPEPLADGVTRLAQADAIATMRARAFFVGGEGDELRAEATDAVEPGDERFRLELTVPSGGPYRVVVEALDDEGTPLFDGSALLEVVAPGVETPVTIQLQDVAVPEAPESLVATALSDVSVLVRWQDRADNETQYDVQRRGAPGGEFVEIANLPGNFSGTVEFTDEGLAERRTFTYRVRARNLRGVSAFSNEDTTTTFPAAPRNLVAGGIGLEEARLTWDYPFPDPDLFLVFRREGAGPYAPRPAVAGTARTANDGIEPGIVYTYRIRAEDEAQVSGFSNEDSVLVTAVPPLCGVTFDGPDSLRFGQVALGSSLDRGLTLRNAGGGTLSGAVAPGAGCAAFSVVQGGGAYALAAGETRRVVVRFTPADETPQACTVNLGSPCGAFVATGTGFGTPVCALDPAGPIDFGTVTVQTTVNRSFTVSNAGTGTLTGTVALSCPGYALVSGGGSFALGAGASRQVTVAFTPTAEGTFPCAVTLGTACGSVSLTGTGALAVQCTLSAADLDFGAVAAGQSADRDLKITNTGGGSLAGNIVLDCEGLPFSIVSGGGAFSLGAGASRTVTVRFAPATAGEFACRLLTGNELCPEAGLAGLGQAAVCDLDPAALDFGSVTLGTAATRSFTITNTGNVSMSGSVSEPCTPFRLTAGAGSYTLGPGEFRVVTLEFAPITSGPANCVVQTGGACAAVSATGTGVVTVCAVSAETLDFGEVTLGNSGTLDFTIRNDGLGVLQGTVSEACADFDLTAGGGSFTLQPDASRLVTVRFTPAGPGLQTCSIELGTACGAVSASGSGVGVTACELEPPSLDFGTFIFEEGGPAFIEKSFTIRNTGTLPLDGSVGESCGPFSLGTGGGAFTLQPDEFRTVFVRFQPTSVGTFECNVNTGIPECPAVPCTGSSATSPNCVATAGDLDFGIVGIGQSNTLTFDVVNSGGSTLSGNVQTGTCGPGFSILSGAGSFTLAAGASRTVTVRFLPTTEGAQSCAILVGGADCDLTVNCAGIGADCIISPASIDFGIVGIETDVQRSFSMRNFLGTAVTGTLSESCEWFSISPNGTYLIPAGGSMDVTVTFSAGMYGNHACTIQTGSVCGTVSCTASVPNCNLFFATTNFGFFFLGSPPETLSVDIENGGDIPMSGTVEFVAPCSSAFSIVAGGGSYTLQPGQLRTVRVRFLPTVSGGYSCDVSFGLPCGVLTFTGSAGTIGKPGEAMRKPGEQ